MPLLIVDLDQGRRNKDLALSCDGGETALLVHESGTILVPPLRRFTRRLLHRDHREVVRIGSDLLDVARVCAIAVPRAHRQSKRLNRFFLPPHQDGNLGRRQPLLVEAVEDVMVIVAIDGHIDHGTGFGITEVDATVDVAALRDFLQEGVAIENMNISAEPRHHKASALDELSLLANLEGVGCIRTAHLRLLVLGKKDVVLPGGGDDLEVGVTGIKEDVVIHVGHAVDGCHRAEEIKREARLGTDTNFVVHILRGFFIAPNEVLTSPLKLCSTLLKTFEMDGGPRSVVCLVDELEKDVTAQALRIEDSCFIEKLHELRLGGVFLNVERRAGGPALDIFSAVELTRKRNCGVALVEEPRGFVSAPLTFSDPVPGEEPSVSVRRESELQLLVVLPNVVQGSDALATAHLSEDVDLLLL